MVVLLTSIVLMVVGIPGYIYLPYKIQIPPEVSLVFDWYVFGVQINTFLGGGLGCLGLH